MWRSYDYEFKQENHVVHGKRSSWGTTYYPPHEEHYYVPPPTMQKMVNNHPSSFHHENFDDSDDDDDDDSYHHHHQHEHVGAVNNNRDFRVYHDHENRNNWYGTHYVSKFPHYGEVSRLEDDYGNNNNNEGIGEELDYNSLMKGMHNGGNKVKLIEMIEYERRTYRGAQQEWLVLGGSDSSYPNKYAPNRVKRF